MIKENQEFKCSKKIRISPEQLDYVREVRKKKKSKTLAGTLDMIINQYKKYELEK